jgi:uncharacterized protein YpmB
LRGRLTLIFFLVTLVLSALVGVLVDVQYRSALNSALDEALETRFLAAADQLTHAGGSTVKPVIPTRSPSRRSSTATARWPRRRPGRSVGAR